MTQLFRIAVGLFFLWLVVRSLRWASQGGSSSRASRATVGSASTQAADVVKGVLGSLRDALRNPPTKQGWKRTPATGAKTAKTKTAAKKKRGTKVGPDGKKGYVDPVRPANDEEIGHWREVADGFADLVGLPTRFRSWRKDKPKKKRFWHTETRSAKEDTAARRKADAEAAAAKPVPGPDAIPIPAAPHPPRSKPGVCVSCGRVGATLRPATREPMCDDCFDATITPSKPVTDPQARSTYVPQNLELFEAGDIVARQKFESIVAIETWLRAVYEGAQTCTTMYQTLASRLWPEMNIDVIVTRHLADAGALQPQVVRGVGEAADAITVILGMSQKELLDKGIKVPHEDLLSEAGQAVIVPTFFELVNTLAHKDFDKDVREVQLLLRALADASEQQQIMYSTLAKRLSEPDMNLDASVIEGLFLAARYQGQISMELAQADAALVMLCNMVLRDLAASPYQAPTARPSS